MNRRQFLDLAALGVTASAVSTPAFAQQPNTALVGGVMPKLAGFVSRLRYEDVPAKALDAAKTAIMDTLGVAVAGAKEESAQIFGKLALEERTREESTVYGQRFKASALEAALVNGVATHAADFDHSYVLGGQPTSPVIPAIFALGEALDSSGRQLIEAYVAGFEIVSRMVFAVEKAGGTGWHANGIIGVLGASAGCAKLLGLTGDEIQTALAIAASTSSGVTANFGTMTKPLHVGQAARNGLLSARLAKSGFTANRQMLEAGNGYFASYYQTARPDLRGFDDLAKNYALESVGPRFKPYPCGGLTHTSIYATIKLRDEHKITPGSVDHVTVGVPAATAEPLVYRVPKTGLEGKFSMPYLIARALIDGRITLATFTDAAVRDKDVLLLLERVEMNADPMLQWDSQGRRPGSVTIRLKNGQTHSLTEVFPKGGPEVPMTRAELAAKFRDCARGVITETSSNRALEYMGEFENLRSIRPLTALLG